MPRIESKYQKFIPILGSYKEHPIGWQSEILDQDELIEVTIKLVLPHSIEPLLNIGKQISRKEYADEFHTSDISRKKVLAFAKYFNLSVVETNEMQGTMVLAGSIKAFKGAFSIDLFALTSDEGKRYRCRMGYVNIPTELGAIIEGVFGLDDSPNATPYLITQKGMPNSGYYAHEVASLYNFPTGVDGTGQCIALIELGGGYTKQDIKDYFAAIGKQPPAISWISVNGAKNTPNDSSHNSKEVMLDLLIAASIAPGAKIVVYFAPNNDRGFFDAINKAVFDRKNNPTVISISWGSPEKKWTKQSLNSYNELFKTASVLGITVCAASGDAGSCCGENDGKVHVDFPASSPFVLACGGTKLIAKDEKIVSEVVWHDADHACTGGGVSEFFHLPEYQQNADVPASLNPSKFRGRGVPDVAGNAAHTSGYKIIVGGNPMVIGGTSAIPPLYAGLIALINQQRGMQVGFLNPQLYANPLLLRQITKGNNITAHPNLGYKSRDGWDACTGLGVLSGF